jgi:hypothetical protein
MILLGAASLYFPDSWVGRNYVYLLLFFGISAYCSLALALENLNGDIVKIDIRLDNLSRELEGTSRGLEGVHDRLWKVEHKDSDTHASGDYG